MFYTIYKITNKINGKVYIGSHKTRNLDDKYMGSGKYLLCAIEKHEIENFTKEILFVFDNPEDMYAKEAELVNEDFLAEANTYNLKVGGFGGWDYVNSEDFDNPTHYISHMTMMSRCVSYEKKIEAASKARTSLYKKIQQHGGRYWETSGFSGNEHSSETKRLIGEKSSINQIGTGNSQYGSMWIFSDDLKLCKKIKKSEHIPEGWNKGRKMKF
jgi:hypothetical protein